MTKDQPGVQTRIEIAKVQQELKGVNEKLNGLVDIKRHLISITKIVNKHNTDIELIKKDISIIGDNLKEIKESANKRIDKIETLISEVIEPQLIKLQKNQSALITRVSLIVSIASAAIGYFIHWLLQ